MAENGLYQSNPEAMKVTIVGGSANSVAANVTYDPSAGDLVATDVQAAIDELEANAIEEQDWTLGTYIKPANLQAMSSSAVSTSARQTWLPFFIPGNFTMTKIGLYLTTAQAGAECRLGLYTNEKSKPKTLVVDAGTLTLASGGGAFVEITGLSTVLTPGYYWSCCNMKNVATQATVVRMSGSAGSFFAGSTSDIAAATVWRYYLSDSFTYGSALDTTAPAMTGNAGSDAPVIALYLT